jgi:hypothetical protein
VHGDEPLIVLVVVMGAVEYLDKSGGVTRRYTATTLRNLYREYCAVHGLMVSSAIDVT